MIENTTAGHTAEGFLILLWTIARVASRSAAVTVQRVEYRMLACWHICMKDAKHLVNVSFRLEESRHRQFRMALARQGLSMQKALERSVDELIARSQYQGDEARRPEDLMGLLADTEVMEMHGLDRREELERERRRR